MNAGYIRQFIKNLEDDEPVVFALIHQEDEKYLDRSIDNNVAVILPHPAIILNPVCFGRVIIKEKPEATIYLIA